MILILVYHLKKKKKKLELLNWFNKPSAIDISLKLVELKLISKKDIELIFWDDNITGLCLKRKNTIKVWSDKTLENILIKSILSYYYIYIVAIKCLLHIYYLII